MHATKKGTSASIVAAIAIAIWVLAIGGCSSGSTQPVSHAQPPAATAQQPVQVQHPPTAQDVATQLHGVDFIGGPTLLGSGPETPAMLRGITSSGIFWIGNIKYAVNVFDTKANHDHWLKIMTRLMPEFSPKQTTGTAVVFPAKFPGGK